MADALEEQGVETHLRTTAKTLLTDESGNVTGVLAEDTSGNTYTIAAKSTILAAGGYAGNAEKIEEYWGLSGLTYVGTIGVVGDMIDAGGKRWCSASGYGGHQDHLHRGCDQGHSAYGRYALGGGHYCGLHGQPVL